MALEITIGSESTGRVLIPVVDGVLCRLTDVKENRFNSSRIDFAFTFLDFEYEDGDDEDNALIQQLSQDEYIHFETVNLPEPGKKLGKGTKFYKLLKGMSGGKEIEEDTVIDLEAYLARDYRIDFEHVDAKSGPPDFAVKYDDKGRPVKKSQIAKIRPVKKGKGSRPAAPTPPPAAEDSDEFFEDED